MWTPQTAARYGKHCHNTRSTAGPFIPPSFPHPGGIKELVNQLNPLVGWYLFLFLFELQAPGRVQQLPPRENLQASNLPL